MLANIGAYVGSDRNLLSPFGMIGTVLGVYLIPKAYINVVGVLSNTNPTAPYRGAGRPEAIYLIERLIDDAARELGVDRIELRRKNMLPESALPYQSPVGPFYDCGEFEKNMDMALKLADVAGFEARKAESKKRGRLRGLGIVSSILASACPASAFSDSSCSFSWRSASSCLWRSPCSFCMSPLCDFDSASSLRSSISSRRRSSASFSAPSNSGNKANRSLPSSIQRVTRSRTCISSMSSSPLTAGALSAKPA